MEINKILNNLEKINIIDLLNNSEVIYKNKDDILYILEYANIIFLEHAKSNKKYINCIKIVEDTKKKLNYNANYDMSIDNFLLRIWEEVNK